MSDNRKIPSMTFPKYGIESQARCIFQHPFPTAILVEEIDPK